MDGRIIEADWDFKKMDQVELKIDYRVTRNALDIQDDLGR